jgi:hypothetical protein
LFPFLFSNLSHSILIDSLFIMAGPIDTPTMHPHTPPRTHFRATDGLSPGKESSSQARAKSPADSGIGDVFEDATATPNRSPLPSVTVESDVSKGSSSRNESQSIMPEDPFDSQHNRILFDAIDALQSFGAGELSIPQVGTIENAEM